MIERNKSLLCTRAPSLALLLLSLMGFAGCSSVPDAVNPVEWYRGVTGLFESDTDQAQRDEAKTAKETAPPLPGTDRPYPNLSTVPERPRSVSSPEERSRVQKGLAADRENARYARPEAERPSGATLGAPAAVPRVPVTVAPSGPSPETLEALPMDTAPVPPPVPTPPRSSLDGAETGKVARAPATIDSSAIQPATYHPDGERAGAAVIRASATTEAPPPRPAQPTGDAPREQRVTANDTQSPVPAAPSESSFLNQTHNAAIAQQAEQPVAARAGPAGGDTGLPRSFMVYFDGGSAKLDGTDRELLKDVAQLYRSHGGALRIVGHASGGTREASALKHQIANLRISTQRAEAVASELARLGVPRASMTVGGVSDSEPLYQETTQSGIAGNRRVEIFFGP